MTSRTVRLATMGVMLLGLVAGVLFTPIAAPLAPVQSALAATDANTLIDFPGLNPGTATATLGVDSFFVENSILKMQWLKSGNGYYVSAFQDKLQSQAVSLTTSRMFELLLANGTTVTELNTTLISGPTLAPITGTPNAIRLAERDNGQKISLKYRYTAGALTVDIDWSVILRDHGNNVKFEVVLAPSGGSLSFTKLWLIKATAPAPAYTSTQDQGSPVRSGNLFMGIEHPNTIATITGNAVEFYLQRRNAITSGTSFKLSAGIALSPAGQMRRAFVYYFQRERAHFRRPYTHWNSWFDLRGANLTEAGTAQRIQQFGSELVTKRGAVMDGWLLDDAWDNYNGEIWSIDTRASKFPGAFLNLKTQAESYGGHLAIWMSPQGGYGSLQSSRLAANSALPQPYETATFGFDLGQPRYYNRFKSQAVDFMNNRGVSHFKFDGTGGNCFAPNGPTDLGAYENLFQLVGTDLRAANPNVYVNLTCGTWHNPYLLFVADSMWRGRDDMGLAGTGNNRQQWISYRDQVVYEDAVQASSLFPVPELMNHGFVYSNNSNFPLPNDLSSAATQAEVWGDMKLFLASGMLQELYIQGDLVSSQTAANQTLFWDRLAKYLKWSRPLSDLLSDSHWVGGNPASGAVYGYASYSPSKAVLALRNPAATAQTFALNPQSVFELYPGTPTSYQFSEIDNGTGSFVAQSGSISNVTIPPYGVYVFEAVPFTGATPTPVPPTATSTPIPTGGVLPRTGWTATCDSQETSGENGACANAIDGSASTIWHTQYTGSVSPLPHQITLNMGASYSVTGLRYLPRPAPGSNGRIGQYEVYVSADGVTWGAAVASGSWADDASEKTVTFAAKSGRYVRLRALSEAGGRGAWTTAAEVTVLGSSGTAATSTPTPVPPTATSTPLPPTATSTPIPAGGCCRARAGRRPATARRPAARMGPAPTRSTAAPARSGIPSTPAASARCRTRSR
ncbi:MAG: discoidin domain-containing protein [Kouleothrix sp.]